LIRENPRKSVSLILKQKELQEKQTDSNRCKNNCHPNPDLAGNARLPFRLKIIPESDSDENDRYGHENNA
jgi:hypothetical protein